MGLLDVEQARQPRLREHLGLTDLDGLVARLRSFGEARLHAICGPNEPDHRVRVEAHRRRLRPSQDVARPLRHLDHALKRSGIVALPVADYEPIEQSRRYVLGETDSFYGVWDAQTAPDLIEQFPLTEEGFDRAAARYHELKRRDRWERGVMFHALWFVMLAGAIAWIVGGALQALMITSVFFEPGSEGWFGLSELLSSVGYAATIGGLVLLAGLALIRRESHSRSDSSGEPPSLMAGVPRWEAVLSWVLFVSLGLWVAFVIRLFFPEPSFFDVPPIDGPPRDGFVVSRTIESLAFRVWVASLVVLGVSWTRRLVSSGGAAPTE